MKLVERHVIKKTNPMFEECKDLCFKSKNLYNRALYEIRQKYINNKKYLNYFNIEKLCKTEKWIDYEALPRKVVGEFQYPIEVCSTPLKLTC